MDGCYSCSNSTYCDTCEGTMILKVQDAENQNCIANEQLCIDEIGYYVDNALSVAVCRACDGCGDCDEANVCTSCVEIDLLLLPDDTCADTCSSPTQYGQDGVCIQCPDDCETCIVPEGETEPGCLSCADDSKYLQYGEALTTCVAVEDCATNTFGGLVDGVKTCVACDPSCDGCTADTDYDCDACLEGYTMWESQCLPCESPCLGCASTSPEPSVCTSCDTDNGYFLFQTTCILECPSSYLPAADAGPSDICTQCDPNCLECETEATHCTACRSSFPYALCLFENACYTTEEKPEGTYRFNNEDLGYY